MTSFLKSALVSIDFINDIVHPSGKLAAKGYPTFIKEHDTFSRLVKVQSLFRSNGGNLIHVRIGFSPSFCELSESSPLLGRAKQYQALILGSWGTEFFDIVQPIPGESVIVKHRISSFYATNLDLLLRSKQIDTLYVAGVATDLAVESTVRDAHDRDYAVIVLDDCCAAANENDHQSALGIMSKIATLSKADSL